VLGDMDSDLERPRTCRKLYWFPVLSVLLTEQYGLASARGPEDHSTSELVRSHRGTTSRETLRLLGSISRG